MGAAMSDADNTLAERAATHGNFNLQGSFAAVVKRLARESLNYADLEPRQGEALDMIITKLARILYGDAQHRDHWVDIQGYAKLGEPNERMRQR